MITCAAIRDLHELVSEAEDISNEMYSDLLMHGIDALDYDQGAAELRELFVRGVEIIDSKE